MGYRMLARAPELALPGYLPRAIFTTYFDRGYRAVDFILAGGPQGRLSATRNKNQNSEFEFIPRGGGHRAPLMARER